MISLLLLWPQFYNVLTFYCQHSSHLYVHENCSLLSENFWISDLSSSITHLDLQLMKIVNEIRFTLLRLWIDR